MRSALIFPLLFLLLSLTPGAASAGGGLVLEDDRCILTIDFYSAHFTAYQPDSRGDEQFCDELPDPGAVIIVLDYLHQSLKQVPVEFRIIRDVPGQGRFTKLKHVEALGDLEPHTVYFQPGVVRIDNSLSMEIDHMDKGEYIGIVTAGHPTLDNTYTAVFPFTVGASSLNWPLTAGALVLAAGLGWRMKRR